MHIASASSDGTVCVWSSAQQQQQGPEFAHPRHHSHRISDLAFSPLAKRVVSTAENEEMCIWNTDTGKAERVIGNPLNSITHTLLSRDGSQLATVSCRGTVRSRDTSTGFIVNLFGHDSDKIFTTAFSADGSRLF